MLVDFEKRNVEDETDEEELLLLLQMHQLQLHLTLRALVLHQEVLAAVVVRQHVPRRPDANGRADAPERFLELVEQRQRHDAAVLQRTRVIITTTESPASRGLTLWMDQFHDCFEETLR